MGVCMGLCVCFLEGETLRFPGSASAQEPQKVERSEAGGFAGVCALWRGQTEVPPPRPRSLSAPPPLLAPAWASGLLGFKAAGWALPASPWRKVAWFERGSGISGT